MNHNLKTQDELARVLGLTDRWIRYLRSVGVLEVADGHRLFDLQASIDAYRAYKDRFTEGRIVETIEKTLTKRYPEGSDSYSVARRMIARVREMWRTN